MARAHPEVTPVGVEALPLFAAPRSETTAEERGAAGIAAAARAHPAEFRRCVRIARELAVARATITVDDVRRAAGLLTSTGRDLAFLGAVMREAGLRPTGERVRSTIPGTHGNLRMTWRSA